LYTFLIQLYVGGTVDLSAVEVLKDGFMKELCQEKGNAVGGQNINDAFLQGCLDSFKGKP